MVLELELRGKLGCNTGATRVQDTRVKTQGDGSKAPVKAGSR